MNKKGFTLFEVVVSVVLISLVLTSMLATLVKLKESYEVVYENTDALIYSSSLSRIMNNDFERNGGIRYIDCNYNGDVCDITLNNNQKRKIEIYTVNTGHLVEESDNLNYFIGNGGTPYKVTKDDKIYCEPITIEGVKSIKAECVKADNNSPVSCICNKQVLSTTLRYSDTTNLESAKNIYLKTLSLTKNTTLETINKANGKYKATDETSITGYNFGKMSFTNLIYDSSNRVTKDTPPEPYKNSISTITIEINDGKDTLDSTYNIYLSSTSTYSPKNTQMGKTFCFNLFNYNPNATKITHDYDALCIKYGVGFYLRKGSDLIKVDKLEEEHLPTITPNFEFQGYYYKLGVAGEELQIVDENGEFMITTAHFESNLDSDDNLISFEAKWG